VAAPTRRPPLLAIKSGDQHRTGRGGIVPEIVRLVGPVPVVEIGPGREDRDPQGRQIIERSGDFRADQRADRNGHAPTTCAVQSARL
jgi:hypothetical protein